MKNLLFIPILLFTLWNQAQTVADPAMYLSDLKLEMQKEWPKNRTISIVFHGHSVPAGYFKAKQVNHPNELGHELIANELIRWFQ